MTEQSKAYMLKTDEGQAIWFAGALMILKAAGDQTDEHFALLDQRLPRNYTVPKHVHHTEDEAWYFLDGLVTFFCGEDSFTAGPGAWVFLPKGIPHTFKVGQAGSRLLTFSVPAKFADFVQAGGQPAPKLVIPPPEPPDLDGLTGSRHNTGSKSLARRHNELKFAIPLMHYLDLSLRQNRATCSSIYLLLPAWLQSNQLTPFG